MEEKKKRVRKKKAEAPAKEDRLVSAYYMLAQVVEHNTMMMKAFIDMIIAKENSMAEEPAEEPAQLDARTAPAAATGDARTEPSCRAR